MTTDREAREKHVEMLKKNFMGLKKAMSEDAVVLALFANKTSGELVAGMALQTTDGVLVLGALVSPAMFLEEHDPMPLEEFYALDDVKVQQERAKPRLRAIKGGKKGKGGT